MSPICCKNILSWYSIHNLTTNIWILLPAYTLANDILEETKRMEWEWEVVFYSILLRSYHPIFILSFIFSLEFTDTSKKWRFPEPSKFFSTKLPNDWFLKSTTTYHRSEWSKAWRRVETMFPLEWNYFFHLLSLTLSLYKYRIRQVGLIKFIHVLQIHVFPPNTSYIFVSKQ